jgi:hypothetical protein
MKILIIIVFVLFLAWIVWSYSVDGNLERPTYKVLEKKSGFEIREYSPYIIAKVKVDGNIDGSVNSAFGELAGYIFGGNNSSEKLAMTTPVETSQVNEEPSEKIAMTAPVETTQSGDKMVMSFMMPTKYSLETLPKANSKNILFEEVPSGKFAVSYFSGYISEDKRLKETEKLVGLLEQENIEIIGEPSLLQYDQPWKFPLARTNEIKIEIR